MWEPQPLATLRASTVCILITLPYHAFIFMRYSPYNEEVKVCLYDHISVCVVRAPLNLVEQEETLVATQRLGEHVTAATNAHGTVVDLLDYVFYMRSVMYQILNKY
jgi:hypothetical protein